MIITSDFIMLNLPKTGSTFCRENIKKVHKIIKYDPFNVFFKNLKRSKLIELEHPVIRERYNSAKTDIHGTYSQIPKMYLDGNREIVSVMRDPFEGYLSRYYFKSYVALGHNFPEFKFIANNMIANFPNISFEEYVYDFSRVYLTEEYKRLNIDFKDNIGMLSYQFIQFFSKEPIELLREINRVGVNNISFDKCFPKIKFLFNENLSIQLFNFLRSKGYNEKYIKFILNAPKSNVTKRTNNRTEILNDEIVTYILEKEALLFRFFPHYKNIF